MTPSTVGPPSPSGVNWYLTVGRVSHHRRSGLNSSFTVREREVRIAALDAVSAYSFRNDRRVKSPSADDADVFA